MMKKIGLNNDMDNIRYMAYGHNCNIEQFKKRIPQAKILGTATLWGWRFELKHFSNIVRDASSSVQGVLYSMPANCLDDLDKDEAYHIHYDRTKVKVDISGEQESAITYVMIEKYRDGHLPIKKELPTAKYVKWIAQGYRENHIGLAQLIKALEERISDVKDMDNFAD
jgi:gamma-glutamylcyclotransferase (GGCT)/AIG2-like uncharacterized protein YtfP